MKVLVIHSRDLNKGSTRYRVVSYQQYLEKQGIELTYVNRQAVRPADAAQYDLVFNQKCRMNFLSARSLMRHARRTLFDFDDAIYTRARKPYGRIIGARVRRRLDFWLARADVVTAANRYLADYAERVREHAVVVPMALDTSEWAPQPRAEDGTVRIGWAGRPGNLRFLEQIQDELAALQAVRPQVRFAVYSGERPSLNVPFEHVRFAPGTEAAFTQSLDIGLLPLEDNAFTRGKSPIKAIQYIACGVPVVGNVIGASAEIVTAGNGIAVQQRADWLEAMITLVDDADLRARLGRQGRADALARHDQTVVREQLLELLRSGEAGA